MYGLLTLTVVLTANIFGKEATLYYKAELLQLNHTQFLLVKKLEIEKTKTTFIISVLKVVY